MFLQSWVLEPLESLSREELIEVILDQSRMIAQLRAEVEQLKKRGGAAPFSKGTHKKDPKRPGRKPGQGKLPVPGCSEAAGDGNGACGRAREHHDLPRLRR